MKLALLGMLSFLSRSAVASQGFFVDPFELLNASRKEASGKVSDAKLSYVSSFKVKGPAARCLVNGWKFHFEGQAQSQDLRRDIVTVGYYKKIVHGKCHWWKRVKTKRNVFEVESLAYLEDGFEFGRIEIKEIMKKSRKQSPEFELAHIYINLVGDGPIPWAYYVCMGKGVADHTLVFNGMSGKLEWIEDDCPYI